MARFLLFVALGTPFLTGQEPAPTGSLAGKVIDEATKAGIRKATVYVTIPTPPRTQGNVGQFTPPATYTVSTDESGAYRFPALPPGPVQLRTDKQGHLFIPQREQRGAVIRSGEEAKAPDLVLLKQGVIAGRVLDADGEPVERITVIAIPARRSKSSQQWQGMGQAATDDRGEYRIARLAPGTYKLLAQRQGAEFAFLTGVTPGQPLLVTAPTYFPSVLDSATAADVIVVSGEEKSGLEIRLQKTLAVTVSGRVSGNLDSLAGINITLQSAEVAKSGSRNWDIAAVRASMPHYNAMAAPDGRFTIPNVIPGEYLVLANVHRAGPGRMLGGMERVRVGQNDLDQLVIPIQPMGRITGKIVTQGSTKLQPAQLNISISSADPVFRGGGGARANEDGTFVIENVQWKRLKADPIAPPGWYLKSLAVGGQPQPGLEFDLSSGDTVIELVYSDKPGSVDVKAEGVTAESGPVIALALPDGGNGAPPLTILYRSARVLPDQGVSKIRDIPPGNYQIVVCPQTALEVLSDPAVWERVKSKAVAVKVEEGVTVSASPRLIVESDVEEK